MVEYLLRLKLTFKLRLNGRKKIETLNTWTVSLLRYRARVIS